MTETTILHVRAVPAEVYGALRKAAAQEHRSISGEVKAILIEGLRRRGALAKGEGEKQ
jgi:hypothetical protein